MGETPRGRACACPRAPRPARPPRSATSRSASARSAALGGDAEDAAGQPRQVDVGAGEGHRRVQRRRTWAPTLGRGLEHGEAVPAGGVHDVLARRGSRRCAASMATTLASMSSGTVSSSRSHARATAVGLRDGYAGQQRRDAVAGGVGLTGGGHDLVAGGSRSGGRQDGADAAGADHADPQERGDAGAVHARTFRSSPSDALGEGRCGYRTCARSDLRNTLGARSVPCERDSGVTQATSRAAFWAGIRARRSSVAESGLATAREAAALRLLHRRGPEVRDQLALRAPRPAPSHPACAVARRCTSSTTRRGTGRAGTSRDFRVRRAADLHQDRRRRDPALPLVAAGACERIRDYNPDMKIIGIFRDPIDRLFSQWMMVVNRWPESGPGLAGLPDPVRPRRPRGPHPGGACTSADFRMHSGVVRGYYGAQLERGELPVRRPTRSQVLEFRAFLRDHATALDQHHRLPRAAAVPGVPAAPALDARQRPGRARHRRRPARTSRAWSSATGTTSPSFKKLSGLDCSALATAAALDGDLDPDELAAQYARKVGLRGRAAGADPGADG